MYPVDLHMHTVASTHAYSTLHDYVAQAKKNGIQLFAITDHGPDMADAPHYWHFVNMKIWPRVIDGIAVLRGIEANIKNQQGDIDVFGPMLEVLDLIVAGFHEPVYAPRDKHQHTEAMIATMEQGLVHIISHPGNPKFPVDIPAIAEAAAHFNVALELNNSSFTTSRAGSAPNCRLVAEAVAKAGGRLAFGSDSHTCFTLGDFEHCLNITQEIGFPEDRILNVTPRRLLDFLAMRTGKVIPELAGF